MYETKTLLQTLLSKKELRQTFNYGSDHSWISTDIYSLYAGDDDMTTLSLDTSKKIYELIGEYETEKIWVTWADPDGIEHGPDIWLVSDLVGLKEGEYDCSPAYGFSELIRILPKIALKDPAKWMNRNVCRAHGKENHCNHSDNLADAITLLIEGFAVIYSDHQFSEPEGMAKVEDYLKKIL